MVRVEVDFGGGQGAKRRVDIRSDLGQASNAGQGQNPPQPWTAQGRRAAGGVARSLQPAAGDAPPSLLAIRPSASTRDPSQYFNSLLVRPAIRGRPIAITDAEIFVPVLLGVGCFFRSPHLPQVGESGSEIAIDTIAQSAQRQLPPRDVIAAEIDSHLPICSPSGLEVYVVRSYELHCRGRPSRPRPS